MYILGLQTGSGIETEFSRDGFSNHDSAAVLLKDGIIIAAIEEERLSRVKHSNFFPRRAIDFCLNQAGIKLSDVNYIAVNYSEYDAHSMGAMVAFEDSQVEFRDAQEHVSFNFVRFYKTDISDKLVFCNHHMAHVWSATALADFQKSLVLVLDGNGPNGEGKLISGLIGISDRDKFNLLGEIPANKSLGHFYIRSIRLIGYNRFDEYKVMGLAPYGDPERFAKEFNQIFKLGENGDYTVNSNPGFAMWKQLQHIQDFKQPRRKRAEFTQAHKDYAAGLQATLETIVMHLLENAREYTRESNLCLAGGVAHNCTLNGKILASGMFENVFVQPASHDAGGALGAALFAHFKKTKVYSSEKLQHLFYGTDVPASDRVRKALDNWSPVLEYQEMDNIGEYTAGQLAEGAIVAWVQGRSEFGPRALGNRSIIADPRPASNRDKINKMIKKREGYRPFAPSVLAERADEYFKISRASTSLEFMNLIVPVRENKRSLLGAITHIDGTARIQVVKKEANPKYWDLISQFSELTDIPILLNTSFNNSVEPIVDSIEEAIACFLTTDLNLLVIGNFVIRKKELINKHLPSFNTKLRESYRLTKGYKQTHNGFDTAYSIEFTSSRYFSAHTIEVSEELYKLLSLPGNKTLSFAADSLGLDIGPNIESELLDLWDKRVINLIKQ